MLLIEDPVEEEEVIGAGAGQVDAAVREAVVSAVQAAMQAADVIIG